MSKSTHRIFAIGIGLAALCVSQTAAAGGFSAPSIGAGVEARIGQERLPNGSLGQQWLVWKRLDGTCIGTPDNLGGTGGFSEDHVINGTNFGDMMVVQSAFEVHCGKNLGPVKANGFRLNLIGHSGNDILLGGIKGSGSISIFGAAGNDIVAASGSGFLAMGEAGDDDVESWGPGSSQSLFGDNSPGVVVEAGPDCLWDQDRIGLVNISCGGERPGTLDRVSLAPGPGIFGCEVMSTTVCCSWAHFLGAC
jgi:Ca2+-binding RTX toxin-like protein